MAISAAYLFNASAERYQDVGYYQHWIVIVFIEMLILFGLCVVVAVGVALYKDPVLYKSFRLMCMWQSVVDFMVISLHGFLFMPVFAIREPVSKLFETISVGLVSALFFTQHVIIFVIAVNRYLSITRPEMYQKFFTLPRCKVYMVLSFIYGFCLLLYFVPCPNILDVVHYINLYRVEMTDDIPFTIFGYPCGFLVLLCGNIQGSPVLMGGIILSILSIRAVRKRNRESNARISPEQAARQKRTLMTSAMNCFAQGTCIFLHTVVSPILHYLDFRLLILFPNTLGWAGAHTFNSLMLILYNPSIRAFVFRKQLVGGNRVGPSKHVTT